MLFMPKDARLLLWGGVFDQAFSLGLCAYVFACPLPFWAQLLIVVGITYFDYSTGMVIAETEGNIKKLGGLVWQSHLTLRRAISAAADDFNDSARIRVDWRAALTSAKEDIQGEKEYQQFSDEVSNANFWTGALFIFGLPLFYLLRGLLAYGIASVLH